MSIPETCKVMVVKEVNGPLVLEEQPVPEPQANEVLVKVLACGVCHSDESVRAGHFGPMVQFPIILGHEIIGDVVKVGASEKKWKVGDRIGGGWHGGHDGSCKVCNKGYFQICDNRTINGVTRNGGYAEYCVLRSEAAAAVPKDVDPAEYAPLLCAGVTVFNSIRHMNIEPSATVAIQGLGGLGHLAIQYARRMGFRTVALSTSDKKKDFAMKLGATDYVDSSKEDVAEALKKIGGASLVVCTAPNPEAIPGLMNGLAPLGKLLILAPVGDVPVNTVTMIMNGISVHGWPSGHGLDAEEAVSFAQVQDVHCMIEKFPLKDAQKAFDKMLSGSVRFRAVLTME
ncbi:GroES-like protein [Aulographum hederae CBS 113979]|uniref:GroES-like protein n=1 Tax=Aulographum hederae CBS 113979 TaxID=1176131 RepID=A0A6G1GQF2_9PEZI|nr:GroES-like protein [Aulographum hederae CBS 113979]